jgi:hypothetical protein
LNANALVKPLNQTVGNALFISDSGNYYYQDNAVGIKLRGVNSAPSEAFEPLDIQFEKIKVQSDVSVKFKLESLE